MLMKCYGCVDDFSGTPLTFFQENWNSAVVFLEIIILFYCILAFHINVIMFLDKI